MPSYPKIIRCRICDKDVARTLWPRDAGGHLKARCAGCMERYRDPKPRKRWNPAQRAAYAREKLGVKVAYVPQTERSALAAAKRLPLHDSHVKLWPRAAAKRTLHSAHVLLYRSARIKWLRRYRSDNAFAVKQRLRTQYRKKAKLYPKLEDIIRAAICRNGESPSLMSVCGYTVGELVAHLEALFCDGMDWDAFKRGEIHIDHKRPQSSFDMSNAFDVVACWSLENLQPLWAADNLKKGAKMGWALAA